VEGRNLHRVETEYGKFVRALGALTSVLLERGNGSVVAGTEGLGSIVRVDGWPDDLSAPFITQLNAQWHSMPQGGQLDWLCDVLDAYFAAAHSFLSGEADCSVYNYARRVCADDARLVNIFARSFRHTMVRRRQSSAADAAGSSMASSEESGSTSCSSIDADDDPTTDLERVIAELIGADEQPLRVRAPRMRRERHLVALPVLSSGFGGQRGRTGDLIMTILPELYKAAARYGFDVALVTNERAMFSALQRERQLWSEAVWAQSLSDSQIALARELASFARDDRLTLFVGAGASFGAGLLGWYQLLEKLARTAPNPPDEDELRALLDERDPLVAGSAVLRFYASEAAMKRRVAELCTAPQYALQHALMATLNADAVVTTNYDNLLELAARAAGKRVAVLPYEELARDDDVFVVKMHGDIDRPDSIVLTEHDYATYNESRQAVAGIVQSLLITKHMLLVGFGCQDPNMQSILDTVKRATDSCSDNKAAAPVRGTTIQLIGSRRLEAELHPQIRVAAMHPEPEPGAAEPANFGAAARLVEVFLDAVASYTATSNDYLCAPMFSSLLSPEDVIVRDAIIQCVTSIPESARTTHSFATLRALIVEHFGEHNESELSRAFFEQRVVDLSHPDLIHHLKRTDASSLSANVDAPRNNDDVENDDDVQVQREEHANLENVQLEHANLENDGK
jgi:SIR2-like domain